MSVGNNLRAVLATSFLASAAMLSAAAPATAAPVVVCDYTAGNDHVKITIQGDPAAAVLSRGQNGRIYVNDAWCDRAATVTNTDSIAVFAGAGGQALFIELGNGGFQPGFTNEPGGSDEIEISVSLGGGDADYLYVRGSNGADNIVAGYPSSGFAIAAINLNANESNGIDRDLVVVVGVELITVESNGGPDVVSAAGGSGTGGTLAVPIRIEGGLGSDTLTGGDGADGLFGQPGTDVLKGGAGPDLLMAQDNVGGNDTVYGGKGVDSCYVDPGDSVTNCE